MTLPMHAHEITYIAPDLTPDEIDECLRSIAQCLGFDTSYWGWQDWYRAAAQGEW